MERVVVTGGGGFVGLALCRALVDRGYEVISVSRGRYREHDAIGVASVSLDLGSATIGEWAPILEGCQGIFHVAAKVDMWGRYEDFYRINVEGTRTLLEAAQLAKVPRFVLTSSPSVVAGSGSLAGVDESVPYPKRFMASYPKTKALAEQLVLKAHTGDGLRTVVLRPHLIWGPGDTSLVPLIVERARSGRLVQVGDGTNRVDLSYIDDCVSAHIAAFEALEHNPEGAGGRPFFISQGEPVVMWDWINDLLVAHGLARITKKIPFRVAYALAAGIEHLAKVLPFDIRPTLTRFLVSEMATDHYFDISAARRELGYAPSVSIAEGMQRTFPGAASDRESAPMNRKLASTG